MQEELPGRGTFDPTENDRAAMRLDRLGNGMGRHFDPLSGDGTGSCSHSTRVNSACVNQCRPTSATSGGWVKRWRLTQGS